MRARREAVATTLPKLAPWRDLDKVMYKRFTRKVLLAIQEDTLDAWLAKIEAATTLTGLQRVFIEVANYSH